MQISYKNVKFTNLNSVFYIYHFDIDKSYYKNFYDLNINIKDGKGLEVIDRDNIWGVSSVFGWVRAGNMWQDISGWGDRCIEGDGE